MITVLLIIHVFVTLALIGVVLIQRSEGGGLGIGSSQGMGSFMSGRGTANLLTRTTAILATIFMGLSLALALLNHNTSLSGASSILDGGPPMTRTAAPGTAAPGAPAPGTAAPGTTTPGGTAPVAPPPGKAAPAPAPAAPAKPGGPSIPTSR